MMNPAVIIVVLTTLLIHCGHCQQQVTFSALQDTHKTLHSLNMRSISNRQSPSYPRCSRLEFVNFVRQECGYELPLAQTSVPKEVACQQQCHDALVSYFTGCNSQQDVNLVMEACSGNNAGTHNATFFKALFLLTFIVMAMLLL